MGVLSHVKLKSMKNTGISTLMAKIDQQALEQLGKMLSERKMTMVLAESMTAGSAAAIISLDSCAGDFFLGSQVVYHDQMKTMALGIEKDFIDKHGAVSSEVTSEMVSALRRNFPEADLCIANTGFAYECDDTSEEKPVGTVFVECATKAGGRLAQTYHFKGDVDQIIAQTINQIIHLSLTLIQK